MSTATCRTLNPCDLGANPRGATNTIMKKPRFKLLIEEPPDVYEDRTPMYHIVDTKLSWRVASNIGMQPSGEPSLEVAEAIVEFLNRRYDGNPVVDDVLKP